MTISYGIKPVLDFTADIEIAGTPVTNRGFTANQLGNNTLITIGAAERLKLYKALLSVSADITGEIILYIGSNIVGRQQNPKTGGQYVLVSCFPDFEYGALGDDLIVNLPSATSVSINVSYEVV